MGPSVDHLVVGAADLDVGVRWVQERLGVAMVPGGVHDGFGTRNALLGLGGPYLEVLALDPDQPAASSRWADAIKRRDVPALMTVAIARSNLQHPVSVSRVRPDGVRLEWAVEFTSTPLFFIDWKDCPRPSELPDGGRISSLSVTTPEPWQLAGVEGVEVREGGWRVDAQHSRPRRTGTAAASGRSRSGWFTPGPASQPVRLHALDRGVGCPVRSRPVRIGPCDRPVWRLTRWFVTTTSYSVSSSHRRDGARVGKRGRILGRW